MSGAVGFSQSFPKALVTYYVGLDYTKYRMNDYGLYYSIHRFYNSETFNQLGQTHSKSMKVATHNFDNYSPWIGGSVNYSINDRLLVIPTIKLHLFNIYSKTNLILRNDLQHNPSFTHKALGVAASFDIELLYKYNQNLDFKIGTGIKKFDMFYGREKKFFADGDTFTRDLKKLSLQSSNLNVGLRFKL